MDEEHLACPILTARYRFVRRRAAGGMGDVHEVREAGTDRRVALKLATRTHGAKAIESLRHEEAVLRRLPRYPHLVGLLDAGAWSQGYYLALEYVDGPSLQEELDRGGPIPVEPAIQTMVQVLSALIVVHDGGYVHRDLKPGNIMRNSGAAKVIDFGLSAPPAVPCPGPGPETTAGTPLYLAPESIKIPIWHDHRSDLYACGHILYEMVTGRHALLPPTDKLVREREVLQRHLHMPPRPISEMAPQAAIPLRLESVILRALEKDPARRYENARKMRRALRAVLS